MVRQPWLGTEDGMCIDYRDLHAWYIPRTHQSAEVVVRTKWLQSLHFLSLGPTKSTQGEPPQALGDNSRQILLGSCTILG